MDSDISWLPSVLTYSTWLLPSQAPQPLPLQGLYCAPQRKATSPVFKLKNSAKG